MDPFWTYAKGMLRYKHLVVLALVMAVVSAGGLGAGLIAIKPVLEAMLGEGRTLPELARDLDAGPAGGIIPDGLIDVLPAGRFTAVVWIVVGLGLLTAIGGLANFLHQYLALTVVYRTQTNLRRQAFHRVVRLPLKDVVTTGPSNSIARIVMDTSALGAGFNALLSKGVAQVSKGIAAFLAALILDWRLTLIACAIAPLLYTVIRRVGKKIRRASRGALEFQEDLYHAATEAIQGLRVVKVHTSERYEAGRFHKLNKQAMRQLMHVRTARALASPLVDLLVILSLGALVLVATKAIIDKHLEFEAFMTVLIALGAAGASLKPLTGIIADIQTSAGAADRLAEMMSRPTETGHGATLPKLPRHAKTIEFDSVTFTYPNKTEPALRDVSLDVTHGETVAVVGPNGSGKTTLLALVPRLFDPDTGVVRIDGQDITDVAVRSLRRQIGVVTQETVLFSGSIRANIAYGAQDTSDESIRAAAIKARADGFIQAMPGGYAASVGEQGLTLSGGQRQRIAIARAILRDPAILILDEATSMIDADSEHQIAEAMGEFAAGRTCLIVAHRLSTVLAADRILVMDEGRLVDQGTHTELLARCPTYQLIARNQLVPGGEPAASEHTE